MHILHIIKHFDFGGAENHTCELANSLDTLGNKVFIIAGPGRQRKKINNTITCIRIRLKDFLLPIHILQLIYYIRKYKIQIIHAHQRFPIFLAVVAGKITHIPVVATVHGRSRYDLRSKLTRLYVSKIIYVSQSIKKTSIIFPEIQHKIFYIPNGVSIKKEKNKKKVNQICYISRLDKNHATLIRSIIQHVLPGLINNFPTLKFNIIGEGKYAVSIKKEALLLHSKMNKEICILSGYQSDASEIIQDSVLVMGVGRVALEALACGTPVFSINQKRMGSMISAENYPLYKENNFVATDQDAPDPNKLLVQLQNFLNNTTYWENETVRIQHAIGQEFDRNKIAIKIETLYHHTIQHT